ncbi:MAG: hypothetical protein LBU91_06720 [Bacteroidales bacterium]|jgi:hypothetical protein|nr:hypothetical protein [Bacteroidales bacterium]
MIQKKRNKNKDFRKNTKLFDEDEHGNIKIIVYDIDKKVITYKENPNEKWYYERWKPFQIVRLKTPETFAITHYKNKIISSEIKIKPV